MLTVTLSLSAAGCGSGNSAGSGSDGTAAAEKGVAPAKTSYPLTIDNCGQKVTFDAPPQRVLIMNGASVGEVETYVLLGLRSHILENAQRVTISDDSKMVAEVAKLPARGVEWSKNFDVPAEKVLDLKPDLVVSTWSGGFNAKSIESTYAFITQTGVIFDEQQKAADLVYDDIIQAAGGENAFPSDKPNPELTSNLSAEALGSADVDVLVIGLSDPSEKGKVKQLANQLFKQYPQWEASKTKTYTSVSDGAFIGPTNAYAVEKIADAAHPQ
ncbi:hypothetical protein [Streptomyces shenzhenensis]|uniref:hypothetical protein n=1 Tax=Streptomyces shenzhenensis TaxID=943815 RepID=UPI00368334A9